MEEVRGMCVLELKVKVRVGLNDETGRNFDLRNFVWFC